MAEYLIQDTTLAGIGDAIRAKEGTTDPIPVPDIASRIAAIQTGVTVQRASGTFTTNSSGAATINCGFQPDLFVIDQGESHQTKWAFTAGFPFYEIQRLPTLNVPMWSNTDDYDIEATRNGSTVTVNIYDFDENAIKNTTFNYIAVKYT